jgi:hypothetical protein
MALEIIKNISVDFYDKKYILINAKQYDSKSRWISITCYNQGEIFNLDQSKHSAYVKYRKADGQGVFNNCRINNKGEVLVELTEQMLAADGMCYVDLVIVNKGNTMVNTENGEIITVDDTSILSTMAFCVNVYETTIDNSEIESTQEYNALNDLLQRAEAEYTEVILLSKSYAVGDAGGIRDNEDVENAKYYYEQSVVNATNSKTSEINAATNEQNASVSETNAKTSETNAKASEVNASASEVNAKTSETNAKVSETNAATSETNAKTSETNAAASEQVVSVTETRVKRLYESVSEKHTAVLENSSLAESYAVGGTGTRENEDVDNAKYYCGVVKSVVDGLNSGFIPIGTISFSELATAEKATGFTYNISNDFVTDETFREGAGKVYTAGTNVYYTADGYWDCFGGSASPTATVDEVRSYLGI